MSTKEEDTLAQEMTKLKVESTQDSATDQQERDESGGSEKKEKEKTSQEKNAESNTDVNSYDAYDVSGSLRQRKVRK